MRHGTFVTSTALIAIACMSDPTVEDPRTVALRDVEVVVLAAQSEMPKCDDKSAGVVYYVQNLDEFLYCDGLDYQVVDLSGQDGSSCTAVDNADGTHTVSCGDGTSVTIVDGATGPQGAPGLSTLIETSAAASEDCPNGGTRFEQGIDENGNGVLDGPEIASTAHVCNGQDGTDGASCTRSTTAMARRRSRAKTARASR